MSLGMPNFLLRAALAAGIGLAALRPAAAPAIPLFAHQYGVSCEKCHSVIPHLNDFGAAFLAHGYRIPGAKPGPAFPISAKINAVYSSEKQGEGPDGAGLPKTTVDGGEPGLTRDAWINDRVNPWQARIPVYAQTGSFTLPLPVDPETFRDTYQGYALYEQTVGSNAFNFFDPKIGIRVSAGAPAKGLNAQIFAGPGHDRQSGFPSTGTDLMG